jgi:hypothetical protein
MEQRRERDPVRGNGRRAAPARGPLAVDPVAAMLLRLQASAGNAAVQRLLSGSATVQRFWPFDDEEDPGGGEETVESEDTGSIPNEGWGGGESSPGDAGVETPSEEAESAAENWIGPGGDEGYDGGAGTPGGESQADGGSGQDWIGPGGDWGSETDGGASGGESQPGSTDEQDWIGPGGDGSGGDEGATEEGEFLTGSPEEQWNQAVEDDDLDEALAIVLRTYGFGGKYVYYIWVNPNESNAAMAGGPLGAAQWISVGYDAFYGGFAWCVSVIGHEMEHAKQRAGDLEYHGPKDEPDESKAPGERGRPLEDAALREFLAYSWEVLDSPVKPENDDLYRACDEAVYAFAYMGAAQSFYFTRKDQVVAVRTTLTVPEAYQKPATKYEGSPGTEGGVTP